MEVYNGFPPDYESSLIAQKVCDGFNEFFMSDGRGENPTLLQTRCAGKVDSGGRGKRLSADSGYDNITVEGWGDSAQAEQHHEMKTY